MKLRRGVAGRKREQQAGGAGLDAAAEHRRQVLFVLEVVDLLAARYGFDPATLVSPRTGVPLGPELARMRAMLEANCNLATEQSTCGG